VNHKGISWPRIFLFIRYVNTCLFLIYFITRNLKLRPYYETNLASTRSSRTPARHTSNPIPTAEAHASTNQGPSWADDLLGFWSSDQNKTQCNSLESEVEAYLSDSRIGIKSMTFWQVSDSDLIIFYANLQVMFRRTSCDIQQYSLLRWTYYPFKLPQSHVSEYSLPPRKP
jgi:hypothetical protein